MVEIRTIGSDAPGDLAQGPPGTSTLVATDDGQLVGYARITLSDRVTPRHVDVELVVDAGQTGDGVGRTLLEAAVARVRDQGGAHVVLWVGDADLPTTDLPPDFTPERELWQMRVPLPISAVGRWPDGVAVRAFVPGADDAAWLALNNRAFVNDPDQGDWAIESLHRRMREDWFDPGGLLLAEDPRGLAGSCWTKVHPAEPPVEPTALGEIYAIGVDPGRQGTGLGRALVVAGLEWLHGHGCPIGMLYVDATNHPAVRLYESLGFVRVRTHHAFGSVVTLFDA
jgi:mycothiol synthase